MLTIPILSINLLPIAGYYLPVQAALAAPGDDTLRVMTLNVRGGNKRIDLIEAVFRAESSDSDLLLLSRPPVMDLGVQHLGADKKSTLVATVCSTAVATRCIDIMAAHLERPQSRTLTRVRDTHLQDMATIVRNAHADKTVVVSDFNLTPWSPYFQQFLSDAGLRDSARGRRVAPTWFSRWLPFGLPIDQVLVGAGISVIDRHVGADVGSDHLPVIADPSF